MNTEKKYGHLNLLLVILMIIIISILCYRNVLIAERTEAYRDLIYETEKLTKETDKTNDLLIEQNATLDE